MNVSLDTIAAPQDYYCTNISTDTLTHKGNRQASAQTLASKSTCLQVLKGPALKKVKQAKLDIRVLVKKTDSNFLNNAMSNQI